MPNDAKLGLVVGVGLTIAVAVVFFSREPAASQAAGSGVPGANNVALQPAPAGKDDLLGREPRRAAGQTTGWQPAK